MADIWMGASRPYTTLADAVTAASAGDTIYIDAGTYMNNSVIIDKPLTLIGVGGMAHFRNTELIDNEKGIIVTSADLTVENLEFSGARVADGNGSGIRYHGGTLIVRNSSFHDNHEGILGGTDADGRIEIYNSSFVNNGNDGDRTHGIYVGRVDTLLVTDSVFEDTYVGSHLKSRAANTEIYNSRFIDGDGPTNYGIDVSEGGRATIVGNYFEQEANTNNKTMISYGSEVQSPGTLIVADNTLVNYRDLALGVYNHTGNQATVKDNTFVNVSEPIRGNADAANNRTMTLDEFFANAAPVAVDDGAETGAGTPVTLDVLANDGDSDGDPLSISAIGAAAHGSVVDNGDGTLTYTPEAGFVGDDSFSYTVSDGRGGSDVAQVAVSVAAPPPPPADDIVLFDAALFSSYAGNQDQAQSQTTLDDGATVGFAGNTWRKMSFDYTVTADTMISFDFRSPVEGEVQGIGFDNDNLWNAQLFQVYGTQSGPFAGSGDLYAGNGGWQSFTVNVGEYLHSGDKLFLTFMNDHDDGAKNGESYYRNLRVYEAAPPPASAGDIVQFDAGLFSSYAGNQDQARSQTILDNGSTVGFAGNTWRKMTFDYTVTADTMISFDFRSPVEGEVQGIGFDNDNLWNAQLFQVYGTQSGPFAGSGDLYTGNGDWQSFTVNVGEYLHSGDKLFLTFMNDHDDGAKNGESYYRNLRVYEAGDDVELLGVAAGGDDALLA